MRVLRGNPPAAGVGQTSHSRACHLSHPNARSLREMRARGLTLSFNPRPRAVRPLVRYLQDAPFLRVRQGLCAESERPVPPLARRVRAGSARILVSVYPEVPKCAECQQSGDHPAFRLCQAVGGKGLSLGTAMRPPAQVCRSRNRVRPGALRPVVPPARLASGESPEPHFGRTAFCVGMDPRGSRALAHTPGRPDTPTGEGPGAANPWPREGCSPRCPGGKGS
jgi:hypothetical protein